MHEDLEQQELIWRKATEKLEEMIEMRTLQTASLKKRKELREHCMARIVNYFHDNCPNDVLVFKLGAMALGEDDDEVDRIVGPMRIVWSKPESDTEGETHSDSDDEQEVPASEFNQYGVEVQN